MSHRSAVLAATTTLALALVAWTGADTLPAPAPGDLDWVPGSRGDLAARFHLGDEKGTRREYGTAVRVGNGTARAYVTLDGTMKGMPLEVGVALTEQAMDGLPASMGMTIAEMEKSGHLDMHRYDLALPAENPTPFRFVEFGWNPAGHEPEGVWDQPHFDFHFYTVPVEVRSAIVKSDPQFAAKAGSLPAEEYRAQFYLDASAAAKAPAAAVTVPQMGLHWIDVRTPEVQKLAGHPDAYRPFTRTFIRGSWDGRFIFEEPMITRAHIMAKKDAADPAVRDEVIPVSTPKRYATPGFYPGAYRITWDAAAREYRIALTQLAWRE